MFQLIFKILIKNCLSKIQNSLTHYYYFINIVPCTVQEIIFVCL